MSVKPIPEGFKNVIPYLICKDAGKVIEFCQKTFDATSDGIHKNDDGKILHATIHIRDSAVMLSEASEDHQAMPCTLYIYVEDVDTVYKRAVEAGGISLREPTNEYYGDRSAGVKDQSGNQWWIGAHIEDVSDEELKKRMEAMKK
jgi:uncharacterized glyoxalase superfamily protein PhnB